MTNILVFPCGSEIGLEIYRSLEYVKDFKVFGASTVPDHGKFVFENYLEMSSIDDLTTEEINQVIDDYEIDFIFPAHDSVVLKLAELQNDLNAIVVTSPLATCQICRSKSKTYDYFRDKLPVCEYANNYPMFLKPDVGQGTKGCFKVNSETELKYHVIRDLTLLDLEYLPGKEYTVDCFTNNKGDLIYAEGRERVRINNGISVNSKKVVNLEFQHMAIVINDSLKFQGVWFFQVKARESGELVLMEIAPRVAGTMSLSRIQGVNLPLLSIYDRMGIDVEILDNKLDIEVDRALVSKYSNIEYSTVYIDFDDTIIQEGKINPRVMQFLYQAKNEGKKIVLLSRSESIPFEYYSISRELFREVIFNMGTENKSNFIKDDSIFIDDSFSERKAVHDKCGIPVFDVNAIGALIK